MPDPRGRSKLPLLLLLLLLLLGGGGGLWWWTQRLGPARPPEHVPPLATSELAPPSPRVDAATAPPPAPPGEVAVAPPPAHPSPAVVAAPPLGRKSARAVRRQEDGAREATPAREAPAAPVETAEVPSPPPAVTPPAAPAAPPSAPAGIGFSLRQRDRVGGAYQLVRATYQLDGHTIAQRTEPASAGGPREVEAYRGQVAPGPHRLSALLEYQGKGFGVFTYLEGYRYKVRASRDLTVGKSGRLEVTVDAHERAGVAATPEQALTLDITEASR